MKASNFKGSRKLHTYPLEPDSERVNIFCPSSVDIFLPRTWVWKGHQTNSMEEEYIDQANIWYTLTKDLKIKQ